MTLLRWWREQLSRREELIALALILVLAVFFRLYDLDIRVPLLFYDEAGQGLDALDLLAGHPSLFFPRSFGKEPLYIYLVVPFVALLGRTILAVRLPAALVGSLTVLATYLLVRELFRPEGEQRSQRMAIFTALLLALSFWHITLSRIGFRANSLPLIEALSFLFLWRGLRTGRLRWYLLSGLLLGLALYTYLAARFLPFFLLLFSLILLATRPGRGLTFSRRSFLLLFLAALLVFAPLGLHFLFNPQDFLQRASLVWVHLNLSRGEALRLLLKSALYNLGLFGFVGDKNWLYNMAGRPVLTPPLALLFWLGFLLALYRLRQPRYLFLLLWLPFMVMPSIVAPDPIPHSTRSCGTIPLAYIFPSLILVEVLEPDHRLRLLPRGERFFPLLQAGFALLTIALFSYTAYSTWLDYFHNWAPREEVYWAFEGQITQLAHRISEDDDPQAVYLFPVNYGLQEVYGPQYRHYTLDFLYQGEVPYHYLMVDEGSVFQDLTAICRGKSRVHFVVWTHGGHVDADPRDLLPFIFEKHGRKTGEEAFRGYKLLTYDLPSSEMTFLPPSEFIPREANFGDRLILRGYAYGPAFYVGSAGAESTPSGEETWLVLRWQVKQPMTEGYNVSITLRDQGGHLVGQTDRPLMSNEHKYTSGWEVGQVVNTYHLLPSLPATPPGEYHVEIEVYEPQKMQGLTVLDEDMVPRGWSFTLGPLQISKPLQRAAVEPTVETAAHLAEGIRLLGYDQDRASLSPGETLHLALYWEVSKEIEAEYGVVLQLRDSHEAIVVEQREQPAYGQWPTSRWEPGDLWRDRHDLLVPPDVASGDYRLVVALEGEAGVEGDVTLGTIEVAGRPRQFTVPPIQNPLVARLGEGVRLLGYELSSEALKPGETLHLTLYWQALTEMDTSYTVFTHLLNENEQIWGQKDSLPGGGSLLTTGWLAGEVLADRYEIVVQPEAPSGEYKLEIGMYDATIGERLPAFDEGGDPIGERVILDRIISIR